MNIQEIFAGLKNFLTGEGARLKLYDTISVPAVISVQVKRLRDKNTFEVALVCTKHAIADQESTTEVFLVDKESKEKVCSLTKVKVKKYRKASEVKEVKGELDTAGLDTDRKYRFCLKNKDKITVFFPRFERNRTGFAFYSFEQKSAEKSTFVWGVGITTVLALFVVIIAHLIPVIRQRIKLVMEQAQSNAGEVQLSTAPEDVPANNSGEGTREDADEEENNSQQDESSNESEEYGPGERL